MMEPSAAVSSKMVDMNMAGVEASTQSMPCAPLYVSPVSTQSLIASAEMRESWPTAICSSSGFLPVFSARRRTKPAAMRFAASGVRVTGSPGTPGTATPRMSLPFASFIKSSWVSGMDIPPFVGCRTNAAPAGYTTQAAGAAHGYRITPRRRTPPRRRCRACGRSGDGTPGSCRSRRSARGL